MISCGFNFAFLELMGWLYHNDENNVRVVRIVVGISGAQITRK